MSQRKHQSSGSQSMGPQISSTSIIWELVGEVDSLKPNTLGFQNSLDSSKVVLHGLHLCSRERPELEFAASSPATTVYNRV